MTVEAGSVSPERHAAAGGDIQAVQRVAGILALLAESRGIVTIAQAVQATGLKRTTAHRYFSALSSAGLLERLGPEESEYRAGPLMLSVGSAAFTEREPISVAPRHLRRLADKTTMTSVLSIWGRTAPVVMLVAEDLARPIVITVRAGTVLGLESAQGTVFATFMSERRAVRDAIDRLDPDARAELDERSTQLRTEGFTQVFFPMSDGVAIAAPVFDRHGMCAAIALIGNAVEGVRPFAVQQLLLATARSITAELGGTFPVE